LNLSPKSKVSGFTNNNNNNEFSIEKIEIDVNNYDQNLRRLMNEAKQLEDDYFPNSDILNDS
jgi:hypothetical protein